MKPAPQLSEQAGDIQALLGSGFGWLQSSRFWLLSIKDVTLARAWLATLQASGLLKSVQDLTAHGKQLKQQVTELAAVAFSFEGLGTLGLTEAPDFPFPTPFRAGMGSDLRELLLRDGPRLQWGWADTASTAATTRMTVHLLLASWWDTAVQPTLPVPCGAAFTVVQQIDGCPSYFRGGALYEPFGFRDGLSQPVIYGLRDETGAGTAQARREAGAELYKDRVVAPGEFIVGYRNEYDQLGYVADVDGWQASGLARHPGAKFGLNGSFLAVRQIEQDVAAFRQPVNTPAPAVAGCPAGVTLAEKLVGRRRDALGTPLGWNKPQRPVSDSQADAFRYRVDDANGFACPRGAHIRRAHPRDALAHDVASGIASSKLHRLLRRGRPYRDSKGGKSSEGLFFIACNTDLERQFEFIHQRWLRNPRFGEQDDEDDPMVGAARSEGKTFTLPGLPSGAKVSLAEYTRTLGGGYFFLPGLKALEFIARPT